MGIKNAMVRMADKAGNAVAKVSALSSAQLDEIERKREAYLSEKPDPSDPQAIELTNRLLATAGVEIHGAYLPSSGTSTARWKPQSNTPTASMLSTTSVT